MSSHSNEEKWVHVPTALSDLFGISRSEARRVIAQQGVKVDGRTVGSIDAKLSEMSGDEIRVGKRRAVRSGEGWEVVT